ncbi:MAG: 2'-5' RNA ligase family protein, partial [Rhodobacteraceae bacterium]|nr:2'-5' RNA ligase family protein [Paracoccaceae bacterium]
MRAFVALDLPEPVVDAIGALQEWLPLGRHVAPDNLHLTLAFLGEQPDGVIAEADAALQGLRLPAFELSLCGVDVFGGPAPGLVFLGVAPNPALGALH